MAGGTGESAQMLQCYCFLKCVNVNFELSPPTQHKIFLKLSLTLFVTVVLDMMFIFCVFLFISPYLRTIRRDTR